MHFNLKSDFVRLIGGFSLVGLVTTLLSLALIFIFLKLLQTPLILTYIGIYVATIVLSFILNSVLVFKSGLSFENGIRYLFVYLSGMLLGTLLLWVFKKTIPLENYLLGYLVLPFTMAWNFAFSYKILKPVKAC
jgi:putative flippase GtrA